MVLRFLSNETWTFGTMGYCFVTCIFVFRILQGWNIKNTNIQVKKQYCLVSKGSSFSYDNPANICWSPKCLQDMSWRRLEDAFSVTFSCLRLQDVLQSCLQDVLEDEILLSVRRIHYVFKTCLEDVFKTYLQGVFKICLKAPWSWTPIKCLMGRNLHLHLTNLHLYKKSLYLTNLFEEPKANPR